MELPLLGLPTKPLSRAKAVPEVAVEAAVPGTIPVVRDEMALVPEVAMEAVALKAKPAVPEKMALMREVTVVLAIKAAHEGSPSGESRIG